MIKNIKFNGYNNNLFFIVEVKFVGIKFYLCK